VLTESEFIGRLNSAGRTRAAWWNHNQFLSDWKFKGNRHYL